MQELTRQGFKLTSGILAQFLALGKKPEIMKYRIVR